MTNQKLTPNENSDLISNCLPLNESLFKEIFNEKLWIWYEELGLISDRRPQEYLCVKNQRILFDETKKNERFPSSFLKKLFSTIKFSKNIIDQVENYAPEKIDKLYEEKMKVDFNKFEKKELIKKFEQTWAILVDNFKYSIIAGLIIQYNIKIKLPAEYKEDIQAKKLNAIKKLQEGKLSKIEFDKAFGFYSSEDYDFSKPRFYELKEIKLKISEEREEKELMVNFREHVKLRNIKLIAIIRKILLAMKDSNIFYKYKEEIISGISVDVSLRKQKIVERKDISANIDFKGVTMSGSGRVEGEIKLLENPSEIDSSCKDKIIITKTMHPDLVVLLPITLGIISETGGKLSHLAIVARESNYPLIGQVEGIFNACKNARKIRMDLDESKVNIVKN